jgi:hypothetical protein
MTNFILFYVGLPYGCFPKRSQKGSVPLKEKSFGEHFDQYKIMLSGEYDKMKHGTDCIKGITGNLNIC